jgi:hypothetical protein
MPLIRMWAPVFTITMGISRSDMLDLSIPEMVDHLDYLAEVRRLQNG